MSSSSLLPSSSSAQEVALALTVPRLSDVPIRTREIWSPDNCPSDLLPWLAWAFGCDEWSPDWSDEAKRQTIREAVSVQRRKGSVWSVRRALANAGYGTAQIIEGIYGATYNGALKYDGLSTFGSPDEWAKYRVILDRPITNKQAEQVRRILKYTAPARCHLVALIYTEVANLYDGALRYDGTYNYGTA
ncbi:phage tail protein I [Aeromonas sp. WP2-W18-CRE-05]|uniref:phage tail protein I n=1 Tax=Aeromonas sp. WP2-W18-CRE-05 TaxID=2675707 RepID=UPI0015DC8EA9|nr:phage tail protein I [Aeromonas sp. WP2-W18-CRE-05]BBQ26437.1 tail fiber protein [Aeromonas sp. WP2-W18-CRE-05]